MWTELKGDACGIAFGGDGSLYKSDCLGYIYQYYEKHDKWKQLGHTRADRLAADANGALWIESYENKIARWISNKWVEMGLADATYVTAGKQSQVFALASPRGTDETVYRWVGDTWAKMNGGMASYITVGKNSNLYITDSENKIFQSLSFNAEMEG